MAKGGKLRGFIGVLFLAITVANVQFGALSSTFEPVKLNLKKYGSAECTTETIEYDMKNEIASDCYSQVGQWEGSDLLFLLEGLALFTSAFIKLPKKGVWANRIRRISIILGSIFITTAILDAFEVTPYVDTEVMATFLPFAINPALLQLGMFVLGALMLRGKKYVDDDNSDAKKLEEAARLEKERIAMDQAYATGGTLKGLKSKKPSKSMKKYTTVGDMWGSMGLAAFEDEFEQGLRDSGDFSVERSCHICSGQGCARCGGKGHL